MPLRKATEDEFKQVIINSKNWNTAFATLKERFGYSDFRSIRRRATRFNVKPGIQHDIEIPDGYKIKGTSTLVDRRTGEERLQWIKTDVAREEQLRLLQEVVEGLKEEINGKSGLIEEPDVVNSDLLAVYPSGEPHIGLFSWPAETGEVYDCNVAKSIMFNLTKRLVDAAPPAEYALLPNVGDWFHSDNYDNVTRQSGNRLDVDTRWPKVFKTGVQIKVHLIKLALKKHKYVKVIITPGNHDEHTSFALSMILDAYFKDNPRVDIDLGVTPHKYYVFGQNLIGVTHGDKCAMKDLPGIMSCDMYKAWGQTKFRYWITGHIHHIQRHEFPGCVVESFRSIAAKDAWHVKKYRSLRDLQVIVYHKDDGEIERYTKNIIQILDKINSENGGNDNEKKSGCAI